jgi:Tol biopolymer transport system component
MSIDIATKETNIFFDTEKNEYQGVISPDGESIAYQVRFDLNQEIYVADLENGALPLLLVRNEAAQFPLWDLNGRTIYYLSLASDPRSIYAVEKDGSNQRSVFSDEKAVWNMDVGYMYIGE